MKTPLVLLSSFVITACVSGYNPRFYFSQIQVANLTGVTVTQVEARVVSSQKFVSCQTVANNAICNGYFGSRLYPQQGIEVGWTGADGDRMTRSLSPGVPAYYSPAFPLQIMIEILSDGSVKMYYKQEDPGRDSTIFIR